MGRFLWWGGDQRAEPGRCLSSPDKSLLSLFCAQDFDLTCLSGASQRSLVQFQHTANKLATILFGLPPSPSLSVLLSLGSLFNLGARWFGRPTATESHSLELCSWTMLLKTILTWPGEERGSAADNNGPQLEGKNPCDFTFSSLDYVAGCVKEVYRQSFWYSPVTDVRGTNIQGENPLFQNQTFGFESTFWGANVVSGYCCYSSLAPVSLIIYFKFGTIHLNQ